MKRLLLAASLFVVAAPGQIRLTLADAVNQAVRDHPAIQASRQQVEAFRGLRRQAGLVPNPTFSLQQENIRSAPDGRSYWTFTDTFAYIHQPLETGGKRQRRVEAAETGIAAAELRVEALRKQIAGRVKDAYWAAAGAQRIYELLLETAKNFLLIVEYHEVRVREGAMAEADLLRVRLESERLNLASSSAYREAETARIRLFREMGAGQIPEAVSFDALEMPGESAMEADPRHALEERTEMKLARLAVEQARAELRLQQAYARPDISAIAGYKRTAGYNSLLAGVSFDLPFWSRNQGQVAAAAARIEAARAELGSMAAVVRAEVAAARKDYEIRRRQILESLKPMRAQAKESAKISQAAYREGGWDLLRLLDTERLRIEIESLYYQALAEYQRSVAALETAMGVAP